MPLVKYGFAIVSLYSCLLLVNHIVTHSPLGTDERMIYLLNGLSKAYYLGYLSDMQDYG
jgi:hypothetical protein